MREVTDTGCRSCGLWSHGFVVGMVVLGVALSGFAGSVRVVLGAGVSEEARRAHWVFIDDNSSSVLEGPFEVIVGNNIHGISFWDYVSSIGETREVWFTVYNCLLNF